MRNAGVCDISNKIFQSLGSKGYLQGKARRGNGQVSPVRSEPQSDLVGEGLSQDESVSQGTTSHVRAAIGS